MLHKGNVGKVTRLNVGQGPSGNTLADRTFNPPIFCPGGQDVNVACEWWIGIDVPIGSLSGYEELRFRFFVDQPNGERQFGSTGWNAWFNGGTGQYRTPPFLEARGWYTGTGYENASFRSLVPYPDTPISGTWTFNGVMDTGSGGIAVQDHGVHVDARFNKDDFGIIFKQGSGSYRGNVSIDTTRLTNGVHCLALRTSSVSHNGGTDTGIMQIPFKVFNSGAPSGNGRGGCAPGT